MSTAHWLSREMPGAWVNFPLPVCWDAEGQRSGATDEEWFLSWDQGAIDPTTLVFAVQRENITCRDCIEWVRA